MFKMYKIMFLISMLMGSIITISSSTWMGMWMGLEINLLSIIPLMNNIKNTYSIESSLKYFMTQALASTMLILSIIFMSHNLVKFMDNSMLLIFNSALLTKMGAAPFHFWFPEVMEGLSWMNCLILLTWQKLAPMILIMFNLNFKLFMFIIIISSMLVSGLMGINSISMRKILAYSSINHIGWMIASTMMNETIWLYYFIIYTMMTINMTFMFKILNIYFVKQMIISMKNNFMIKMIFILNFLSLGGLPPFMGFFPKWLTIQSLINSNMYFLSILMVILTLLTLFYYVRLTFSTLMINNEMINFNMKSQINPTIIFMNVLLILSLIICTTLFNFL